MFFMRRWPIEILSVAYGLPAVAAACVSYARSSSARSSRAISCARIHWPMNIRRDARIAHSVWGAPSLLDKLPCRDERVRLERAHEVGEADERGERQGVRLQ